MFCLKISYFYWLTWKTSLSTDGHFDITTHSFVPHLVCESSIWNCPDTYCTDILMTNAVNIRIIPAIFVVFEWLSSFVLFILHSWSLSVQTSLENRVQFPRSAEHLLLALCISSYWASILTQQNQWLETQSRGNPK